MKDSIYEGGLLVPALLEWPARLDPAQVISIPSVTSDIYPTILEMAGVTAQRQPPLDGISLLPVLEGDAISRQKPIGFWRYPAPGKRVPAKEWMEELRAAQKEGREPEIRPRLGEDAENTDLKMAMNRFPGHAAWLQGSWKLHRIENPKTGDVQWELYDVASDPAEAHNLLKAHSTRGKEMGRALERWLVDVARSHNGADY